MAISPRCREIVLSWWIERKLTMLPRCGLHRIVQLSCCWMKRFAVSGKKKYNRKCSAPGPSSPCALFSAGHYHKQIADNVKFYAFGLGNAFGFVQLLGKPLSSWLKLRQVTYFGSFIEAMASVRTLCDSSRGYLPFPFQNFYKHKPFSQHFISRFFVQNIQVKIVRGLRFRLQRKMRRLRSKIQ